MPTQKALTREQVRFYAVAVGITKLIICELRTDLTINRMHSKIGRDFGVPMTGTINLGLLFKDFFDRPLHINFFIAIFKNRLA